jgi:porin
MNLYFPPTTQPLLGDPYTGIVELEYAPTKAIALRLQYSGGELLGSNFGVFGVNAELAITLSDRTTMTISLS